MATGIELAATEKITNQIFCSHCFFFSIIRGLKKKKKVCFVKFTHYSDVAIAVENIFKQINTE